MEPAAAAGKENESEEPEIETGKPASEAAWTEIKNLGFEEDSSDNGPEGYREEWRNDVDSYLRGLNVQTGSFGRSCWARKKIDSANLHEWRKANNVDKTRGDLSVILGNTMDWQLMTSADALAWGQNLINFRAPQIQDFKFGGHLLACKGIRFLHQVKQTRPQAEVLGDETRLKAKCRFELVCERGRQGGFCW